VLRILLVRESVLTIAARGRAEAINAIDLPILAADDGIVTLKKRANSGIRLIIQCAREVARPVAKARE
jgi:hypothetical protein